MERRRGRKPVRRARLLGPALLVLVAIIYTRNLWGRDANAEIGASRTGAVAGLQLFTPGGGTPALDGTRWEVQQDWIADAQAGTKYLDFLVCMGFCNQLEAFMDGVALAHLLNLTLVLPKWYRHYEYFEPEGRLDRGRAQFDPQKKYAVDIGYFFDMTTLRSALSGWVKVVDELPEYLRSPLTSVYEPASGVDPQMPTTLGYYKTMLRSRRVLRIRCPLLTVKWNNEHLGQLRKVLLGSLRPSQRIQQLVDRQLAAVGAAAGGASQPGGVPYLALHLRNEADWWDYCQREVERVESSWVTSVASCYYSASATVSKLRQLGLQAHYPVVYVASGNFTQADALQLLSAGFRGVVSQELSCQAQAEGAAPACQPLEQQTADREVRAAVDFQVLLASDFFVGNVYSSFSGSIRTARLVRRDPLATLADALYINAPLNTTAGDMVPLEARRLGVSGGTLHPQLYAEGQRSYAWLLSRYSAGQCLHKWAGQAETCRNETEPPRVLNVTLTRASRVEEFVGVTGWVNMSAAGWYPRLDVLFNGTLAGSVLANSRGIHDSERSALFRGQVQFQLSLIKKLPCVVVVTVCSQQTADGARVCSRGQKVDLRPPLELELAPDVSPVLYIHFPYYEVRTGGPEALHQLHQEINRWHAAGEIAVRSVFPRGAPYYEGRYSNLTKKGLTPEMVTPRDYLLVPEELPPLPSWWSHTFRHVGVTPIVWYLGQHHQRLVNTRGTRAFKPVCISNYFAHMYVCSSKAVLNTPMNGSFLDAANGWRALQLPKEDIVVFDPDLTSNLDITQIKLPPGARLQDLNQLSREEVIELYRRAKVLIDSYVTGMERAVFESAVFNVVPLIAVQGNARHPADFPLPPEWRWQVHDYEQLSGLVARALADHQAAVAAMEPLRQYVQSMASVFSHQVWRYFQDDVHIIIPALGPRLGQVMGPHSTAAMMALLAARELYPFASAEVVSYNAYYVQYDHASLWSELEEHNAAYDVRIVDMLAELARFGPMAAYLQLPQTRHHRDHVLLLPPGGLPLHPDLAAALFRQAFHGGAAVVRGPQDVLLVKRHAYYAAVLRLVPELPSQLTVDHLVARLQQAGLQVAEVRSIRTPLPAGQEAGAACPAALASLYSRRAAHHACLCPGLSAVLHGQLWQTMMPRVMLHVADDPFYDELKALEKNCAR